MNKIMQKLHSRSGASMLLAMVFIMFCTFIGGTVLAAATANGSRVAKLTHSQQAYLSQRSAALVLADQLTKDADNGLQLTIVETITDSQSLKATPQKAAINVFQDLLYKLTENKFAIANGYNIPPITSSTAFTVADHKGNVLDANYVMSDNYGFTIKFADGQLGLYLEPVVGTTETQRQELSTDGTVKTIVTRTTIIRWNNPVIVKGGA